MATFRIKFPEKEEPSVVVLNGNRLTVGRLPDNTIQIVDRIISAHHAEIIAENGHYRLHDLGSANGTFVNDQPVEDYHLKEPCKVSFGTVECEFSPEKPAVADGANVEPIPSHAEVVAVREENSRLKAAIAALKEEVETLKQVRPLDAAEGALAVTKEEFEKVATDRELLQEAEHRREKEILRLKADIAVLRRDRENLQQAWDQTKQELEKARAAAVPGEEKKDVVEDKAAPATAASAPAPVKAPTRAPISAKFQVPASKFSEPSPSEPHTPKPPYPLPEVPAPASAVSAAPAAPSAPAVPAPAVPAPAKAVAPPVAPGKPAFKPFVKPPLKAPAAPGAGPKPMAKPVAKAPMAGARPSGPRGTQKLPPSAIETVAAGIAGSDEGSPDGAAVEESQEA